MNQAQRDNLARALGIPPSEQSILDAGSNHSYSCRCSTCIQWWIQMGPDGDPSIKGAYGPFTRDEILAEARRLNLPTSNL